MSVSRLERKAEVLANFRRDVRRAALRALEPRVPSANVHETDIIQELVKLLRERTELRTAKLKSQALNIKLGAPVPGKPFETKEE